MQEASLGRIVGACAEIIQAARAVERPAGEQEVVRRRSHRTGLAVEFAERLVFVAFDHRANLVNDFTCGAKRVSQEEMHRGAARHDARNLLVNLLPEQVTGAQGRRAGRVAVLGHDIRPIVQIARAVVPSAVAVQHLVAQGIIGVGARLIGNQVVVALLAAAGIVGELLHHGRSHHRLARLQVAAHIVLMLNDLRRRPPACLEADRLGNLMRRVIGRIRACTGDARIAAAADLLAAHPVAYVVVGVPGVVGRRPRRNRLHARFARQTALSR